MTSRFFSLIFHVFRYHELIKRDSMLLKMLTLVILIYVENITCWDNQYECQLFLKTYQEPKMAMPLLPEAYPFRIERKSCNLTNPLIVGGQNATYGEFPHMLAVGYKLGGIVEWLCGGTLISPNFVLTAAHCADTKWGSPDLIRIGSLRLDSNIQTGIAIQRTIIHPDYKPPKVYNDIALLKLTANVTMHYNLRPACLSTINDLSRLPKSVVVATGWGHTEYDGKPSSTLLKVSLKLVGNEECQTHFPLEDYLPNGVDDSLFCAVGYYQSYHDTCNGDSGGPVHLQHECSQEVIGITSFGKYCGSGSPAIYTKVAFFMPWINTEVAKALIDNQ